MLPPSLSYFSTMIAGPLFLKVNLRQIMKAESDGLTRCGILLIDRDTRAYYCITFDGSPLGSKILRCE